MTRNIDNIEAAIRIWMKRLDDVPGWQAWNRQKIRATLAVDDRWDSEQGNRLDGFTFPEPISREHAVVMSYYGLVTSLNSLRDCEYYFRRYPFRGLPVGPHDHLRYVCEMYFGRFYEFSERMKVISRAVSDALPCITLPFGALIKDFGKEFKPELRERNLVHHRDRFEDARLDNIAVLSIVGSSGEKMPHLKHRARESYRAASKEWAVRVRQRSLVVENYLEAVAALLLAHCHFLR